MKVAPWVAGAGLVAAAGLAAYIALRSPGGVLTDARRMIGSLADQHGKQARYEAAIRQHKREIRSLESDLRQATMERDRARGAVAANALESAETASAASEAIEQYKVADSALGRAQSDPAATEGDLLHACLAAHDSGRAALAASRNEVAALRRETRSRESLAAAYSTELATMTALRNQERQKYETAAARVRDLRKPRFRIGPGIAVGITLRDGQVAPSYSAGLVLSWGR